MDNSRRARRHLQRAQELLGFGYADSSHETRYNMKFGVHQKKQLVSHARSEENEPENSELNMVSDGVKEKFIGNLDSCEEVCKLSAVNKEWRDKMITDEKLKEKLSLNPKKKWSLFTACQKCQQGRVRLKSVSEAERKRMDIRKGMDIFKIYESDPDLLNNIDIIVEITEICSENSENSELGCILYKDVNGNFTKIFTDRNLQMRKGEQLGLRIEQINTENECWIVINHASFFCKPHRTWEEIKKRMNQTEFGLRASN